MKAEELKILLDKVSRPIYKIEADLGMPKTTLQKAVRGERDLPKKWAIALKDYLSVKGWIVGNSKDGGGFKAILDANKPTHEIKPPEQPKTNYTINTEKQEKPMSKSEWLRKLRENNG